jgi:exodeoxyribonuclease VII large subunit
METLIFSVSQLTAYIKGMFSSDPLLRSVYVRGEISNYKLHSSGHSYFTLKDHNSKIRCVMFRQYGQPIFAMQDGMDVLVQGYVNVYDRDGQYQLYAERIEPFGVGSLHLAFEQLKAKLEQEGLFDQAHKKPLPLLPKRIGVVTSDTGSVVRDIINVAHRRYPNIDLLIVPVAVQGKAAAVQISEAIDALNVMGESADVIIVGRGGGSIEELWPFNEEVVARSIYRSHIPVVSAVGHETDFTISDFVADMRAPTPSAAAELVVPLKTELEQRIAGLCLNAKRAVDMLVEEQRRCLYKLQASRIMRDPMQLLKDKQQRLDQTERYLLINMHHRMEIKGALYNDLKHRLEAFNPLGALKRGYAMTLDVEDESLIKSVSELSLGQRIHIIYDDGRAQAEIVDLEVERENDDRR